MAFRDLGTFGGIKPSRGQAEENQSGRRSCDPKPARCVGGCDCGRVYGSDHPGTGIPTQPFQIGAQFSGALVADIALLLQRFIDDAVEFGRKVGVQAKGRGWIFVEDGIEDCCRGITPERQRTGGHFVQHGAK